MKQKRIIASLAVLAVLMLALSYHSAPIAFAYSGTNIYVNPLATEMPAASAHVGDTFQVSLGIANFTNLYGYQYVLHWNSSVINVVSVHDTIPTNLTGGFIAVNTTGNGFLNFTYTSTGAKTFTGDAVIRTIIFNITSVPASGNATSSILWGTYGTETIFGDNSAQQIPATTYSGIFRLYNIIPEYAPLAMLLAVIMSTSIAVAVYKRKH